MMRNIILKFILLLFLFPVIAQAAKVMDVDTEFDFRSAWYQTKKSEEENLKFLIKALTTTEKGKEIVSKASKKAGMYGLTLMDVIGVGEGSLTDTTLIRKFSANDPTQVLYETRSKVFVNRRLKLLDAVLDFAHELTHFTYRDPFNPYVSHFHLDDFIKSTVEGTGGEVEAFVAECHVLKQLRPGETFRHSNCQRILDEKTGEISREVGVREFYKVGKHFPDLKKDLEKFALKHEQLPQTSGEEAPFISSAYGLPYPVAAIKEYTNIMDRVCRNDQNRINLLQEKLQRSPASIGPVVTAQSFENIFEDFRTRCERFVTK